jgi:uncharacterized protein YceH (UPF0502 family)
MEMIDLYRRDKGVIMELELNPVEERILGCLIEKEMATPEYYPLTLNALVNACNQKSNRFPVMALDEAAVEGALYALRTTHRLAVEVTGTGSRVPKYRHNLAAHWNFSPAKMAILCELFIRGPQTAGDLRARASRLHALSDAREVEEILQGLAAHDQGPFVVHLEREAGKRERRWAHLFAGDPSERMHSAEDDPAPLSFRNGEDRIQALEEHVEQLRNEIADLKSAFETFKAGFE